MREDGSSEGVELEHSLVVGTAQRVEELGGDGKERKVLNVGIVLRRVGHHCERRRAQRRKRAKQRENSQ